MKIQRYCLVVLLTTMLCLTGCSMLPTGDITRGVYYKSNDLSGYTRNEVYSLLQQESTKDITVTIKFNDTKMTTVKASDLGIILDVDATAQSIYNYGYEDSLLTLIAHRTYAFTNGVTIDPIYKLDEVKGRTYLTELAKQVDEPIHDAYLTIENGVVKMIPSQQGKRIDIEATLEFLKNEIQKNNFTSLSIVYTSNQMVKLTNEDVKPLTMILGSYTTYYDESNTTRTHNIEIASQKINGTLIKPGQVFSFNDVVGERTAEAGFDDAPVMIDGKLVPGIGGGICQVSSTLFNTALLSGMDIVERTPHFEPVSYIPDGRDATVAWGYLDFQFKNPYNHSIYVISIMENNELTIYIVGVPQDAPRSVSITVGDSTEIPNKTITRIDSSINKDTTQEGHYGAKMNTYRHIIFNDGTSYTDTYESIYDPVDTIIIRKSAEPPKKPSTDVKLTKQQ